MEPDETKPQPKREQPPPQNREPRSDPPGGQISHEERKGDSERQPEEPHGDSEAV